MQKTPIPSEPRIQPRCSHASLCGGCSLQHLDYKEQLKFKQEIIQRLFAPFEILPILGCSTPWEYRGKMEFSFSQDKEGNRFLGLMMRGRRRVLNLSECHLVSPWFIRTLKAVRQWWEKSSLEAYFPPADRGSLRTLTLREGKATCDKMVVLTVSGNPSYPITQELLQSFVAELEPLTENKLSIFLRVQQILKGQPTQFYEMHLSGPSHIQEVLEVGQKKLIFNISPSSFFQPNPLQAELLYTKALELAALPENAFVLDLYAGTATLGMIFASKARRVLAIESNPNAVLDAEENRRLNQVANLELLCSDAAEALKELKEKPDLVILDPPRSGLHPKALEHLIALNPAQILYISCNPFTQAENINSLTAAGYRLFALQPIDQLPHTPHIETIAVLKK